MNYYLKKNDILEILTKKNLKVLKDYFYNYNVDVNSDDINEREEDDILIEAILSNNVSLDKLKYIVDELYPYLDYTVGVNDTMFRNITYSMRTPLSVALSVGNSELCDYLLEHGADINYMNRMFILDDDLINKLNVIKILSKKDFILDKELLSNDNIRIEEHWLKIYLQPNKYTNDFVSSLLYFNRYRTAIPKKEMEQFVDTTYIKKLNKLYEDEISILLNQDYFDRFYNIIKYLFHYDNKTEDEKYFLIYKALRNVEPLDNSNRYSKTFEYINTRILEKDEFDQNFLTLLKRISLIIESKEIPIKELIKNNNLVELKEYVKDNNIKFTTILNEYRNSDLDCTNVLTYAAENINRPIFDYLIDAGANPNQCRVVNAISSKIDGQDNKETFIKYLIEKGGNIDYKKDGNTALSVAITTGQDNLAKYLIQHGASVNDAPINYLIQHDNKPMVEYLVENGFNINTKFNNPLGAATVYGNWSLIKFLIEHGADINKSHWIDSDESYEKKKEPYYFAPLLYFVLFNKELFDNESNVLECIKYLVEHGADVNQPFNNYYKDNGIYRTPLCAALELGSFEIVKYLVEHGADVNKSNCFYRTPLIITIDNNKKHNNTIERLNYLIKHGANVNLFNKYDTPLTYAIKKNKPDLLQTVKCLVENGANVKLKPVKGDSPLNETKKIYNRDVLKYLLENGAGIIIH